MRFQIRRAINNIYTAFSLDDGKIYTARIKGKVMKKDEVEYNPVAVGDIAIGEPYSESEALVTSIEPRKSSFARWNVKKEMNQIIASNQDQTAIVVSSSSPPFRPRFLDRAIACSSGADILIIDPENEYQKLCEAVGGSYIRLSLSSDTRINPFDLPRIVDQDDVGEGEEVDSLRANLITLHGLLRQMLGASQVASDGTVVNVLTPSEEADLDQALIDTYARVGITSDPLTQNTTPPVMADLYDTLAHMGGNGPSLAQRLRQYTTGTFAGIFSQQSNVEINNHMVVFNIRDLEDELRPVAMYIVLNHIWSKVRTDQRKRLLVVDEAWQLMKYPDSANFMFSLAKRARKYNLGLTTVTQDVEDFISSPMGRAIVANSSIQLLLKQSPSAVDVLGQVFKLTEEELKRLSNFAVGQGLFFAGQNHVMIQIIASETETGLISTTPVNN